MKCKRHRCEMLFVSYDEDHMVFACDGNGGGEWHEVWIRREGVS